jgi:2-methylcitrate dehydratase PrpD
MTTTSEFLAFIESVESLPEPVVARSKLAVRDYFGVAIAGTRGEPGETLLTYADGAPSAGSSPVLDGSTAASERAALLNGAFGHGLDYDDTFASFPLHPTVVVTPAALAAGERADASGDSFLRAYALGVETLFRVGQSVFPRQYDRGFHSTAAVGPLGAAVAAGILYDLDTEELANALGIAASSAGGLRKNFGTTTKPLHAGFAASAGLRAAHLARAGATADRDVFDGESNYGVVMAEDAFDPDALTGSDLVGVPDIALKLYPSGHISHGAMAALGQLHAEHDLRPEAVRSITATIHPGGQDVMIHDDPATSLQAKFSMPFCLAATLRSGSPGLAEFTDDYVAEAETQAVMDAVEVEYDADAVAHLGRYGGIVRVETDDGTVYEAEAEDAPGSPRNPADEAQLREKFDECLEPSPVDGDRLATAVDELDHRPLADVLAPLRAA